MNSFCIVCASSLGSNETFEMFPVGKRFAFDAVRGRLWVICPRCQRWNLTPLEERWEAVEAAERMYRETRERLSTGNIGLARLADGTTLVRIGEALRPEFAAWRYGDHFGWRRRRGRFIAGGATAVIGAALVGALTVGAAADMVVLGGGAAMSAIMRHRSRSVVARVRTQDGEIRAIREYDLETALIGRGRCNSLMLHFGCTLECAHFEGSEAERVAAVLVPMLNRAGAERRTVNLAVDDIERSGGPRGFLDALVNRAAAEEHPVHLTDLPREQLLAFEMALHEETERRAMQGELAALERAWRDAEEIAAIEDELSFTGSVEQAFLELKSRA
jgi:hypothetical protein